MHFFAESFAGIKKTSYLCIRKREIPILASVKDGPFVYRLGRKIFILERGVRFSHGLHNKQNHRIRQAEKRRLHNRYYAKTMRNAVKKLRMTTDKTEAVAMYPNVQKILDKLAKRNIIHKNKAANLKSKLAAHIAKLA